MPLREIVYSGDFELSEEILGVFDCGFRVRNSDFSKRDTFSNGSNDCLS